MIFRRSDNGFDFRGKAPFDVEEFLAAPRVARVATKGPIVRPVWFLWEQTAFWVFVGPWSGLVPRLTKDSAFDLVVDDCDLTTGRVQSVTARGSGTIEPFDVARARRKLVRYLGPDEERWDPRFSLQGDYEAKGLCWARLVPERMIVKDMSFKTAGGPS